MADFFSDPSDNKPKQAVALLYNPAADNAPRVIAKGKGEIAERIIDLALENGVKIHQDKTLVNILSLTELDQEIPVEALVAVAEILSYIYRENGKIRQMKK